jgi:hypothetical protein
VSIKPIFSKVGSNNFFHLEPKLFKIFVKKIFQNSPEELRRMNILIDNSNLGYQSIFYRIIFSYYDNEFRRIFSKNDLIFHYLRNNFGAEKFDHITKKVNVISISDLSKHTDYTKFNLLFSKYVRTEDNVGNTIGTLIDSDKFFAELATIDMVTLNNALNRVYNVINQVTEFINDDAKFLMYLFDKLKSIKTVSKVVETIEIDGDIESYIDAVDKITEPKELLGGICNTYGLEFDTDGKLVGVGIGSDIHNLNVRDVEGYSVKSTNGVLDDDTIIFDSFEKRVHTK